MVDHYATPVLRQCLSGTLNNLPYPNQIRRRLTDGIQRFEICRNTIVRGHEIVPLAVSLAAILSLCPARLRYVLFVDRKQSLGQILELLEWSLFTGFCRRRPVRHA
jgi:hypothetical protein